jgi:hypothetical protein
MANANLLSLVRQVNYELNKKVRGRKGGKLRELLDVYEHSFTTGVDLVKKQVDKEIKTRLNIPNISRNKQVSDAINIYVETVYNNASRKNKKVVNIEVTGNKTHFTAVITPIVNVGQTNVFDAVQRLRKEPLRKLAETLEPIINSITDNPSEVKNVLFGTSRTFTKKDKEGRTSEIEYRSGGLLQQGHSTGASVAEKSIFRWAAEDKFGVYKSKVEDLNPILLKVATTVNTAKSNRLKELGFEVDISKVATFDESATLNMRKGSNEEKAFLKEIRNAVNEAMTTIFNKKGTAEWAAFKSSSSSLDLIPGRVTPKKLGGMRPRGKLPKEEKETSKKLNSQLQLQLQRTVIKSTQADTIKGSSNNRRVAKQPERPEQNWNSLLPLINSKLTPRVIANMRFPSLVNRTGTFAQSAEVVRIEETREGFPSFVFNYERDPYDVFDRTLGRAPWNTPERDPRALVDKSLREIVREMAINRFYTRRA